MLSNIARPTPVVVSSSSTSSNTQQSNNNNLINSSNDIITNTPIQQRTSRTYFRPPGLGPDIGECPDDVKVCPHCGFSCPSQFHYNSHMNTHAIQQCTICDYQSRTQGRLKKHMQQNHTAEERLAAGIFKPTTTTHITTRNNNNNSIQSKTQTIQQKQNSSPKNNEKNIEILNLNTLKTEGNNTIETNKLESLQSILNNNNNTLTQQQFSNSTDALLKICTDAISNNGPNEKSFNSPQIGDLGPTAFDQFRALAERQAANLLATSTANSLGFVEMPEDEEMALVDDGEEKEISSQKEYFQQNNNGISSKPETSSSNRRAGKPKQYKCKQCPHLSHSKKEQWTHARLHIPKQKQLCCTICDFVTEYKHHLEYHYRNHNGQKPFNCPTCAYTCVNKSMLNSHMKSHTPNFQFKCMDCTYQTKYSHSLRMHLRKYKHKVAPGAGIELFDSSDSHGEGAGTPAIEDRPENASSSSASKEESFEGNANNYLAKNDDLALLKSPATPHHDLVVQPLVNNSELDLASQHHFILQQQIEQMHELICNAVVNCPHCNFSTGNIDEMNQHLFLHLIATHQQMPQQIGNEQEALATIYHRLTAQLHQELAPTSDTPTSLLSQELPAAAAALHINQEEENIILEKEEKIQEDEEEEDNFNNNLNNITINNNMDISSVSTPPCPTSLSNNNEFISFNNNNNEEDNILTQQQQNELKTSNKVEECQESIIVRPIPSSQHGLFSSPFHQNDILSNLLCSSSPSPKNVHNNNNNNVQQNNKKLSNSANFNCSNEQNNSISTLPFYCEQCDIAFRDGFLYQLHRGYHSIGNPFKCNHCGQHSNTALEFNLHLYQAKHE